MSPYKKLKIGKLYQFNGKETSYWTGFKSSYFVIPGYRELGGELDIKIGDIVFILEQTKKSVWGTLTGRKSSFWYKILCREKIGYMPFIEGDLGRWTELKGNE